MAQLPWTVYYRPTLEAADVHRWELAARAKSLDVVLGVASAVRNDLCPSALIIAVQRDPEPRVLTWNEGSPSARPYHVGSDADINELLNTTFRFDVTALDEDVEEYVETYQGLKIFRGPSGYSAQNGGTYAADGAPSLEDARAEIDAYWAGAEHGPLNGIFPPGTPPS